jgi:hypothetical protein
LESHSLLGGWQMYYISIHLCWLNPLILGQIFQFVSF